MIAIARASRLLLAALLITGLTLAIGAVPSTAVEKNGVDREAVQELHEALEALKKEDPDAVEGNISEDAMIKQYYGKSLIVYGKPNGCSTPKSIKHAAKKWNAIFKSVCNSHDKCYSKSSKKNRLTCDKEFRSAMHNVCAFRKDLKICKAVANVYYAGVRVGGWRTYEGKGKNN